MSEGLVFRKFRRKDLPRISGFRKSFFSYNSSGRSCEPEYYGWKCYKNLILPGEMWLAEDGDKLVAIKNVTPKRMKVLGAIVNVAEMGDSFTHPDYRRRGIFTALSKAARESVIDKGISLIYNIPSKNTSLPGYIKKLNHTPVPTELRRLVKPLIPKQLPKRKLLFLLLVTVLSPVVEVVSQAIWKIGMRGITKSDVLVRLEPTFPDDIDVLWEQASKNYDIMLARTTKYLKWRYVTNPDTYSILIARNQDGTILGYMVTKIGSSESIPVGFIADFLTLEDDPNIFKKLLANAMENFCHRKVSTISTWAIKGSFYDKNLLMAGFFPRNKIPLLCYENELGSQIISKAYKWHLTMGDSDNI